MAALIAAGHLGFGCNLFHFFTSTLIRLSATATSALKHLRASGLDELAIPVLFVSLGYYIDVKLARHREQRESALNKERLATLARLAGSVAHHIRTPLSVIQNSIHFLEQSPPPDAASMHEVLTEMKRAVKNSDHIITEMLEYVLNRKPHPVLFPVNEAILGALRAVPVPGAVHFEAPGPEMEEIRVYADKGQIINILSKLIQNAIQSMPQGGELAVSVNPEGNGKVCLSVRDRGCGIPKKDLSRIFEPLFSTKLIGLGLGLAIAQKYALLNGCSLSVASNAGHGTEFRLLFHPASLRFSV